MQGKSVPPDVLADYPELEKTAKLKREIASIPSNSGSPTTQQELSKPHPTHESPKGWIKVSSGISNAFSRLTQRLNK